MLQYRTCPRQTRLGQRTGNSAVAVFVDSIREKGIVHSYDICHLGHDEQRIRRKRNMSSSVPSSQRLWQYRKQQTTGRAHRQPLQALVHLVFDTRAGSSSSESYLPFESRVILLNHSRYFLVRISKQRLANRDPLHLQPVRCCSFATMDNEKQGSPTRLPTPTQFAVTPVEGSSDV
ncbi:hypothetical protein CLAIMM_00408 [Cladophialophora immunda]|nr:hypothetical protein CLAIMM_00408 [Cladophialophora immunda]